MKSKRESDLVPMSIDQLHNHIDKLETEMDFLDNILLETQNLFIKITGLNNLNKGKNDNWKNKLTQLLFHAAIPIYWITDISSNFPTHKPLNSKNIDYNENVNTVYVQAINNITKEVIKQKLKYYLDEHYHNT